MIFAKAKISCFTLNLFQLTTSNMRSSRAFGFNSKPKKGGYDEDLAGTPGPNNYATHNDNTTRTRAPISSLSTRTYIPGDPTLKPGPGAYSPEKVQFNNHNIHATCTRWHKFIKRVTHPNSEKILGDKRFFNFRLTSTNQELPASLSESNILNTRHLSLLSK